MRKLNIGSIPFLNAKPIAFGIEMGMGGDNVNLRHYQPAECARMLAEGTLDIGLIPSIEYARNEAFRIVPEIVISSCGPSASVLLFLNKPVEKLQRIALDNRSRTSIALLKILCAEVYKITPEFVETEADYDSMLSDFDAALIIGDLALYSRKKSQNFRDLSEDWFTHTNLPFVFAFWAGIEGAVDTEELELFHRSLEEGLQNIQKISSNYPCPGIGNGGEINEKYLTQNISYSFGDEELTGLKLFYIKAWEHDLIEGVPRIRFYEK